MYNRNVDTVSGAYYSMDVLSEIFRNEDVAMTIQAYPEEVSRRVTDEIEALLDNFVRYSRRYEDVRVFNSGDTQTLFKFKLLMDYYAIMYIQASKNVHIYRAYRWNLIEEIATVYSGYYDFIPESVVSNLSDVECSHLRERCLEIRNAITVVNNGKYSLIGILKDIVTDDLSEPRSGSLKFYAQNTKLVVPSYMVDILKHSKLIKILIIDL
ncbi:hypothetical protein BEWA_027640 [Theileria equi strain WA]|uniref:GINS subunit domain-containing protein n=1 Tax=Theileria equi strain WA TaxID=1537102 RepID=L0AWK1_THEEQ|nr:hypothetical protein BEWA_027640 [Theileria equi strain WA]AFZ79915.1 hypothetical protein BEWA_027640 [Theileria equi strain WA]|eukprot:XP_004829581.1 hypothetical protein BEWA_027640 [Theileria equi strain WA]